MNKNFNEMSFDELKCYRREGLWRSLGLLLVIILVITGMVLMEVNHVSPSNQNRFRVIGLTTVIALFGYLMPLMAANRVMRDHPDWIKKSGFGAKIPLPMLAFQKTLRPWSESTGDWSRICLTIQTTSSADKFTRSNRYHSNGS